MNEIHAFDERLIHTVSEDIVEDIITKYSQRKCHGIKPKNPLTYQDTQPIALWCWELTQKEQLEPIPQGTITKVRASRATIGKKVVLLQGLIKLSESKTLGEEEELAKINNEFERYNLLL